MMRSLLMTCLLVACSVWAVQGRYGEVILDEDDWGAEHRAMPMDQQLAGTCFVCKTILNKVKTTIEKDDTLQEVKNKLLAACKKVGPLKSICQRLVEKYIAILFKELCSTDDSVRTMCVKIKACKPKDFLMSY